MIKHLVKKIEQKFESHQEEVKVNEQITRELFNVDLQLSRKDIIKILQEANFHFPATIEDKQERNKIIQYFINNMHLLVNDLNSRQYCYQPKYEGKEELAACLSCFHVLYRKDSLQMNVYIRSQNFDKNFRYDICTFCIVLNMIAHHLKVEYSNIYIKIASLHKIL